MTELLVVLAGLLAGLVGGVLGVGGGVITVPVLTIAFGLGQASAQATSLATIVPTSLVGAVTADRQGNVLRSQIVWMGAAGVVGAVAGALLALALPAEVLTRVFGVFLAITAWRMWPRRSRPHEAGERR